MMKEGMKIRSVENPEWGTFTVLNREVETMWAIRGERGTRTLSEGEFNQSWEDAQPWWKVSDPIVIQDDGSGNQVTASGRVLR